MDFPSAVVIARAILETYLSFYEIFVEPKDDEEFEYRRAVYEIKGFKALEMKIRRNPAPSIFAPSDLLHVQSGVQLLEKIRDVIRNSKIYQTLNSDQQKSTLEGIIYPKRTLGEVAAAAGFGKLFIEHMYMYMSSFTHGDSLSAVETASAHQQGQEDLYFVTYMVLIMMVLALVIRDYAAKFPEAQAVCAASPSEMRLVRELLLEVARTNNVFN